MPWRGPEYPGEFPTLGYEVAQWIQDNCVIPDREDAGDPFVLTSEQLRFLLFHYQIDPETGRWHYERGSQLIRPRKWGKAPLTAAMVCAEAAGPVLFDGWNADGEPVGKQWPTPWIQCVACSEDQVANVWRVLIPMIQLGSLNADIPDTGDTRVNLPNGRIEPVTAAARSRFGQRTTFAAMDETHLWGASNGGHKLAETLSSNLAGTSGRFIETTNAFDPVERSVAQRTFESRDPHVFKDDAPAPAGSVRNKRERDEVLIAVYGDSLRSDRNPRGWIDKGRIHVEIESLLELGDGDIAERMFMNRKIAQAGAAFDIEAWTNGAKRRKVPRGETITIGIDGARHDDALAVVATEVKTGYQWPLGIWERPPDAGDEYEHPQREVDAAVSEAFEYYVVWRVYADPQYIKHLLAGWQNEFGEKRVHPWETYRPRPIAYAVRRYEEAIAAGEVTHDGDETFTRHIRNSRRRKLTVLDDRERPMHTLAKDSHRSPRKIDAAMAAVLSWEARVNCIQEGGVWMGDSSEPPKPVPPEPWAPDKALAGSLLVPAMDSPPLGNMS